MADLFLDDYDHCDTRLIYSPQNIPGRGADLNTFECQMAIKCKCVGARACGVDCACGRAGSGVNYDDSGRLLSSKLSKYSAGVIECGSECACDSRRCGNRIVQHGPVSDLKVVRIEGKGLGLKRTKDLKRGDFICEYAGEIIGKSEAKLRAARSRDQMNFIFVLEEHNQERVVETYVDPTYIGNIGRYINHSCRPNAKIVPVRFNSMEPHLAIFAVNDIAAGCEITYDYSGETVCQSNQGSTPCLCGEDCCNKFIPFNPNLF